jgi:hypothetical protein
MTLLQEMNSYGNPPQVILEFELPLIIVFLFAFFSLV